MDLAALNRWYHTHGKRYPWRGTRDPYRILVTEIMLQRTRADKVADVYGSFFERFPTRAKFSRASMRTLGGAMATLGLNHRVPRMVELAHALRSSSRIPSNREGLLSLPGVGPYIADAVLCYAFGKETVPIDVNIERVFGRYFGDDEIETHIARVLWQYARHRQRDFGVRQLNWAFLDLAKSVCKSATPHCADCPIKKGCQHREPTR